MQSFTAAMQLQVLSFILCVGLTDSLVTRSHPATKIVNIAKVGKPAFLYSKSNSQPPLKGGDPNIYSGRAKLWRKEKGGGWFSYAFAILFVLLVGSMPIILHAPDMYFGRRRITMSEVVESILLYVWLSGGLYLFTNVLIFQSVHFEEPRTLSLEEAVYLFSQILTTVGYGDITPAKPRGQLFIGFFVFLSIVLIANMVSDLMIVLQEWMERRLSEYGYRTEVQEHLDLSAEKMSAFKPVVISFFSLLFFIALGTLYFHYYPGEEKSWSQGIYMSTITLSTVGFGAFTPTTHAGMVFCAFWMLFGVAAFGTCITAYAAFSETMKDYEISCREQQDRLADDGHSSPHSPHNAGHTHHRHVKGVKRSLHNSNSV